ncbi:MAG: RNA-binding S4 domain-containing protein [Ruminococcus sp.]|jgi:ribosomal 50S subunit-recycling heat shock protein|nr:RNA-binding S4 domain-containing protein [Ruminococcus sp.]
MRLDKFLKVSRLIKRRTVANEVCDAGKITANGKTARASYDVKIGDIIGINLPRALKIKVLDIKETVRKEDASDLFEIISE